MVQGMRSDGHKMHEIVRSPGLCPGSHWGAYSVPQIPRWCMGKGYNLLPKNPTLLPRLFGPRSYHLWR